MLPSSFKLSYRTLFFFDNSEPAVRAKVLEELDQEFLNICTSRTYKEYMNHTIAFMLLSKFARQHAFISETLFNNLQTAWRVVDKPSNVPVSRS